MSHVNPVYAAVVAEVHAATRSRSSGDRRGLTGRKRRYYIVRVDGPRIRYHISGGGKIESRYGAWHFKLGGDRVRSDGRSAADRYSELRNPADGSYD